MSSILPRARWHKSITDDVIMAAAKRHSVGLDDPGICLACGEETDGVEPDAERYTCDTCGEPQVYGAEQLLMYLA